MLMVTHGHTCFLIEKTTESFLCYVLCYGFEMVQTAVNIASCSVDDNVQAGTSFKMLLLGDFLQMLYKTQQILCL